MDTVAAPSSSLTVANLMSRGVMSVGADLPLREAARQLAQAGVHGGPVVDDDGRCVGVLSMSDVARETAGPDAHRPLPHACSFQKGHRDSTGNEWVECQLALGACVLQRMEAGRVTCADPSGICTDWQLIDVEALPADEVRRFMTTEVVTASPHQTMAEVARLMLERAVHRIVVLDADRRPVGLVSVTDVLRVVATADWGGR
jgi:CBS domain-containing protein